MAKTGRAQETKARENIFVSKYLRYMHVVVAPMER